MLLLLIFLILIIFFDVKIINYKIKKCLSFHIEHNILFDFEENSFQTKTFNPSICYNSDKIIVCARYSNNSLKFISNWVINRIFNNSFSTIVFFVLDKNFNIKKKIIPFQKNISFQNFEDPRIIFYNNNFYISCTKFYSDKKIFPCVLLFDNNLKFQKKLNYIFTDDKRNHIEKNWNLIVHNNQLYLHTDAYPRWKIYKVEINNNKMICKKLIDYELNLKFSKHLRCSTGWKNFNDNYFICGLHSKIFNLVTVDIKSYFVLIDKISFLPVFISKEICFSKNHERIQFLSGLEIYKDSVICSIGIGDYKFKVIEFSKKNIKKILHQINE